MAPFDDPQARIADLETDRERALDRAESLRIENVQLRDRVRELEHECAEMAVRLEESERWRQAAMVEAYELEMEVEAMQDEGIEA